MTVIAYRDGIMAADTGVWVGDICIGNRRKISRLPDGSLYAGSGAAADVVAVRDWLAAGQPSRPEAISEGEDFGGVLVKPGGGVFKIDRRFVIYEATDAPWAVEGAHTEFLLGALCAGASAEEAVLLAIRYGDSAHGDVQVERLGG